MQHASGEDFSQSSAQVDPSAMDKKSALPPPTKVRLLCQLADPQQKQRLQEHLGHSFALCENSVSQANVSETGVPAPEVILTDVEAPDQPEPSGAAVVILSNTASRARDKEAAWQLHGTADSLDRSTEVPPRVVLPPETLADVVGQVCQLAAQFVRLRRRFQATAQEVVRLRSDAFEDPLTGLLNRRGWQEVVARQEALWTASEGVFCLALFDIDDFKQINDRWGHSCGDRVLQQVGGALRQSVRQGDPVARLGGDEFAVLLPNLQTQTASSVVERLRVAACGSLPLQANHSHRHHPDHTPPPHKDSSLLSPVQNSPAQNSPAQNSPAQNSPAQNSPAQNSPAKVSSGRMRQNQTTQDQTVPAGPRLTVSAGYAVGPGDSPEGLSQLFEAADRALLQAKADGKDCLCGASQGQR